MSIGAIYKDPRSGLVIKHKATDITFHRVGKGIVAVTAQRVYKVHGEASYSFKNPIQCWLKLTDANELEALLIKTAELFLETRVDLREKAQSTLESECHPETAEKTDPDVPCTTEASPVVNEALCRSSVDMAENAVQIHSLPASLAVNIERGIG
jgi:hypothetical protein